MMKTIKKIVFISITFISAISIKAQNCGDFVNQQAHTYGYSFNTMSKSGTVKTGKKYKFVFTLNKGKSYRFQFFASSGLNNNMDFKITDKNSNQQILYLPGEYEPPTNTSEYNDQGEYDDYGDEGYGDENNSQTKTQTAPKEDLPDYKAIEGIAFKSVLNPEYYNEKLTYPFFEFKPANTINLEIIIDVKALEAGVVKKGCLAILLEDKEVEDEFQSIQ